MLGSSLGLLGFPKDQRCQRWSVQRSHSREVHESLVLSGDYKTTIEDLPIKECLAFQRSRVKGAMKEVSVTLLSIEEADGLWMSGSSLEGLLDFPRDQRCCLKGHQNAEIRTINTITR